MRETQPDAIIESKLEAIEKWSTVKKPDWLAEEARSIFETYKDLRESIVTNSSKWGYFDYTLRIAHNYYTVALSFYTFYHSHKNNLDISRIAVNKCISKLDGIRSSEQHTGKTDVLYMKATGFKQAIDKIYNSLENKLDLCDSRRGGRIHQAKVLLNLGHVDYENFNFFAQDLSAFHSHALGVLLVNFLVDVEEKIIANEEIDHYSNSNIYRCLARGYQICGQHDIYDIYNKKATIQISRAFQSLSEKDNTMEVRRMVRNIVKEQVLIFEKRLVDIYKDIKREYNTELTNFDCIYVERKFIKYCTQGLTNELHEEIVKKSKSNNIDVFIKLLSSIRQIKTLADFQDSFSNGAYYRLFRDHQSNLKPGQLRQLIQNFKKDIFDTISPKLSAAQKELDVLKQLILFLRSVSDCRTIILQLKLHEFCIETMPIKMFFTNVLSLNIPGNNELGYLKCLTKEVMEQDSLIFMKMFVDVLQSYTFPPNTLIENDVMTLKGKLIILSEVMKTVLEQKTDKIKELRILGPDVVFIDEDLKNCHWAGVNILVVAKTVHVHGKPVWNVSGVNAANYPSKADDGLNPGDDGKNGKHGIHGQSGGNVYIDCHNMIHSENLTIVSNGGHGGTGQAGGNGAQGCDGKGIRFSEFENFIDSPHKISSTVKVFDIKWSDSLVRLNVWNSCPSYFTGTTEDKCKITYAYYPGRMPSSQEVLAIYEGTHAQIGGRAGKGGLEGSGGFAGEVIVKCGHPHEVSIDNDKPGEKGNPGAIGNIGHPGRNGWDMAFGLINGWFSKTSKIYGRNQDCKISVEYYDNRKDVNFVYNHYMKNYVQVKTRSSKTNVFDRNQNEQNGKEEQQTTPTRSKAISRKVISEEKENISSDVFDQVFNLALELENLRVRALEEIVEKDEEKEWEMTNYQTQRQAEYDDSALQKERKILRKRQKYYIIRKKRQLFVDRIIENPTNIDLWLQLKSVVVDTPEDLTKLFTVLLIHKPEFGKHFTSIYNNLLSKYKILTCQKIDKTKRLPEIEVYFEPTPIENYLIVDSNAQEYANEDLGILQEYFQPTNYETLLPRLQNYLKNLDNVGQIIYPLKFFIMEKSYSDPDFKKQSQVVLEKLNKLENRLERLIKCYIVANEKDGTSSMLFAIEQRKNELIEAFRNELVGHEFIRTEFVDYVEKVGISSTAVRELLSCAFDVNIKIFIINGNKELVMYHNHNPTAKNVIHLFLVNGQFVEFRLDDAYINLITERKKLSKNYNDILKYVNEFVCKKDFDELFSNFEQLNEFESNNSTRYLTYKKLNQDEVIDKICAYFPPSDNLYLIRPVLNKLKSNIIQNENILLSLLERFDIEGMHISPYELVFIVNTILRSFINKTANLEMFEWILSVKSQSKWLNEMFYIELENYFKKSLKSTSIGNYIATVKQKDILLLMDIKLRQETPDNVNLRCITTCLEVLSEIEIDEETVRSLPLSKWQYTLREQLLEYRLCCIAKWESSDQMLKALYYLNCIETTSGSENVNKLLGVLHIQKNEINAKNCIDILTLLHMEEWSLDDELLDKLARNGTQAIKKELTQVQRKMGEDRSLKTLLKLIKTNSNNSLKIKEGLESLEENPFLTLTSTIQPYSVATIKEWSKQFQQNISGLNEENKKLFIKEHTIEILVTILNAIRLRKGFLLRTTQRLAMLLMLNNNQNILSQISTGEGKSLIVVAVSIFKALCGEKVDILTSSSVLAKRDATIHTDIYDLFDISVSHNCSNKLDERRDAYSKCPVIFGTLSCFQRDYLLDRFYGMNVLGDRTFDILIVDEVDSMVLDKGNNSLYLTHEIAGLDKLESVYRFIWRRICMSAGRKMDNFANHLKQEVLFDLYGTVSNEDLELHLKVSKEDANAIYNSLKDIGVIDKKHRVLKDISAKDTKKLSCKYQDHQINKIQYIINKILKRNREIRIPKNLYKFVELHLDVWIKNGRLAIVMEEGIDYVLDVDRTQTKADVNPNITIMDKGTGTDQSNSQWEEALHQFIQLKHGCKVSPQSLKAVFISNVSYFQKYSKLFGLTGTLGSQVERDLLKDLYKVQFVNIPTAKPKKFIEQEPILCCTETDWAFRIVNRTTELIQAKRSVLVICETVKEVNILTTAFRQSNIPEKKIYKREHEECLLAQGKQELNERCVIIATNLAGRGTDFKVTDRLNKNGGLHVLLTYLPSNARILQQAFGRAARCGCNGSGQLIIIGYGSFLSKREQHEEQERQRLADIKVLFDTKIKVEEAFFENFTKIYKKCNNKTSFNDDNNLKNISSQRLLDRWAFWIDENGSKLSDMSINKVFSEFINHVKNNFSKWETWTEDPIQLVKVGLNFIKQKSYQKAIEVFDTVIRLEPEFCEAAHYYKAAALAQTLNFEKRPFTGKNEEIYKQFIQELKNAERLFEAHKDACMESSAFIQNLKQKLKDSFMTIDAYRTQQESMITLYNFYIRSIHDIVGHQVHKSSFRSQEIDEDKSEEIYKMFLNNSVLKHSHIIPASFNDDIEELSTSFGIPFEALSSFLKAYEGRDIEEEQFLTDLKQSIKMPSLEECWETLVSEEKLINEVKFVVILKSKLTTVQEDILKEVNQLQQENWMTSRGKQVFMKQYNHSDETENTFIFEENLLKLQIGENLYNTLKKENILICNRTAQLSLKNLHEPISLYDTITVNNLTSDNIVQVEAEYILSTLTEKGILKNNTTTTTAAAAASYSLSSEYDENKLPIIPPYNPALLDILRLNFAYRIALLNMQHELKTNSEVYVKMVSEPHVSLMWELIGKNIIQPVSINNHSTKEIDTALKTYGEKKITKHVKSVLEKHVGRLKSLDTPTFILANITDYMDNLPVSPLQELNTFTTNSLDFILKTVEKPYTWKMISSTLFVTILGLLEIAAGLTLQLFFLGMLSHVGNFLINEGVSDLQYATSCWWTGYFNWNDYGRYKLQSMIQSLVFTLINGLTPTLNTSKFGNKLAMRGVIGQSGIEVAEMTGRQLIQEVGGQAIAKEFGMTYIAKVGQGITRGLMSAGVNSLVDSYLQNLFNQIASNAVEDIETAVNNHCVNHTIQECYRVLGPQQADERINYFNERCFSTAALDSVVMVKTLKLATDLILVYSEIQKVSNEDDMAQLLIYFAKALEYSQYAVHVFDIVASVTRMLDKVDQELKANIEVARLNGIRQQVYSDQEIRNFTNDTISEWRMRLKQHTSHIVSEKIARPVLQYCAQDLAKMAKEGLKKLHNFTRNKYHKHVFDTSKTKRETALQDKSLLEETKKQICTTYHDTLTELKSQVRDPNLYAEIVMEKGHMDAVCLRATSHVLDRLKGTDSRPIKLTVETDVGAKVEYCTPGVGDCRQVNLKLVENHYTSSTGTDVLSTATDYECLYRSLSHEFSEVNQMTMDEFRSEISKEIKTNEDIQYDIKHGKHEFIFRKKIYGGHRDQAMEVDKFRRNLMEGKYQSSTVPIRGKGPTMHLIELTNCMAVNFEKTEHIKVVSLNNGRFTYLDNKKVIASATINNPDINMLVRSFKYNEVVRTESEQLYVRKTTIRAAANRVRIRRGSFVAYRSKSYTAKELRIQKWT